MSNLERPDPLRSRRASGGAAILVALAGSALLAAGRLTVRVPVREE